MNEKELRERVELLENLLRKVYRADNWAQPQGQYERYDDRTVTKTIREAMKEAGLK